LSGSTHGKKTPPKLPCNTRSNWGGFRGRGENVKKSDRERRGGYEKHAKGCSVGRYWRSFEMTFSNKDSTAQWDAKTVNTQVTEAQTTRKKKTANQGKKWKRNNQEPFGLKISSKGGTVGKKQVGQRERGLKRKTRSDRTICGADDPSQKKKGGGG